MHSQLSHGRYWNFSKLFCVRKTGIGDREHTTRHSVVLQFPVQIISSGLLALFCLGLKNGEDRESELRVNRLRFYDSFTALQLSFWRNYTPSQFSQPFVSRVMTLTQNFLSFLCLRFNKTFFRHHKTNRNFLRFQCHQSFLSPHCGIVHKIKVTIPRLEKSTPACQKIKGAKEEEGRNH